MPRCESPLMKTTSRNRAFRAALVAASLLPTVTARAAAPEPTATATGQPAAPTLPAPPPSPYSLPWQLRPAVVGTVVRSDTAFALLEDASANGGSTIVSSLLGTYKLTPQLAPLVRLAVVDNAPPTGSSSRTLVNPVIGATYGLRPSDELRAALFFGVALPVGMGGGDTPDAADAAATKSGIAARSAMDNAMYAVNYLTVSPGADIAWVKGGLTVQLEATLLQLVRVRGGKVDKDEARTNLTAGLHLGYFVIPELSVSGEIRYQRWLSTPAAVAADMTGATRDVLSVAAGPRFHFKVGESTWIRPGVAYAQGLDDPMSKQHYRIVQLDLPVSF